MTEPLTPQQIAHYAQPVEYGEHPATCSIPDCDRPHRTAHLCGMHYARANRWRKQAGLPRITREALTLQNVVAAPTYTHTHPDTCAVPVCERPYYVRGLCRIHYQRWKRLHATW